MRGLVVPSLPPFSAAVPVSVISSSRPSPTRGYSHHFPMTNVVSVQSVSHHYNTELLIIMLMYILLIMMIMFMCHN